VAAFFPVALLFNRNRGKALAGGYLVLLAVEAATFAPQGVYIARNWDWFNGRAKVVVILNDPGYRADPVGTMLRQLNRNLRGPWDGRVNNTAQYSPVGEPQLDTTTGALVAVGMALTLLLGRVRRRPETWLWWLMLLGGWGLTQLTTVGTPNGARGVGYMPTLVYFSAVALDEVVVLLGRIPARTRSLLSARRVALGGVTAAIVFTGFANVEHYVNWQRKPRTRQDRYLYVTAREFPAWAADVIERARGRVGMSNVEGWRASHPIYSAADPYGTGTPP
jgi:hypothetical protein